MDASLLKESSTSALYVQERLADLIAEHICRCPEPHQIEELLRDSRASGEDGKETGQRKMDYVRKLAIQI